MIDGFYYDGFIEFEFDFGAGPFELEGRLNPVRKVFGLAFHCIDEKYGYDAK